MSERTTELLIKDFIKQVKEKLPEWLKEKKDEADDILDELEEHIREKSDDLSGKGYSQDDAVRLAISHMGTPSSIAREYKRRGTPKYYITEELWPIYTKVLAIVCSVIIIANVIFYVLNLIFGTLPGDLMIGFMGVFAAFTVITIIFIALSMEGYFPEDFKSPAEVKKKDRQIEKAKVLGLPISQKTGEQLKPFIKPGEKIGGGIFGMIFGFLLIIQPIPNLSAYFTVEFLMLVRLWGITSVAQGSLNLIRGVIGNQQPMNHQIILGIMMGLKVVNALFLILVIQNPGMLPWIDVFQAPPKFGTITPEFYELVKGLVVLIMAITLLSMIEEIYWMVKLEQYKI
ncbi:MAG: permease prefix domain 1-containing protein [Promethearchaeota archaeon]